MLDNKEQKGVLSRLNDDKESDALSDTESEQSSSNLPAVTEMRDQLVKLAKGFADHSLEVSSFQIIKGVKSKTNQ
jgi:hypothetical protein